MEVATRKSIWAKILSICTNRILFSVIYLITSLMWYFPIVSLFFDLPMKIVFLWGLFLIIYDFFTKRIMFSGYGSLWLVLFGISYAVTIFLNIDMLYDGIKHFIYNGILIYVIYCFASDLAGRDYKKWFVVMNDIVLAIVFIASLISLIMFALRFTYTFTRGNMTFSQGIVYNRLHGVYTSANTGAILSMLSIGLMGINLIFDKLHFKRLIWFYIPNAVIQFLYYSLTLSKGGHLILLAGILACAIVFVYPYFVKNIRKVAAVAMTAVCFFAGVCATELATIGSRKLMLTVPTVVSTIKSKHTDSDEPIEKIELERVDSDKEMTNGRITIWQSGIALLKESPIFGVCDARVYSGDKLIADIDESLLSELNISELKRANGYMHNAVIQILVFSGVVGLLLIAVFTFVVAKKYILSLIRLYGTESYTSIAIIFVFLFMLVSQVPNEAHILFNRQDPYAIMFWLYLGLGMHLLNGKIGKNESEALFICDTPYQVMNALRIAEVENKSKCDIYIYDQFHNASVISEKLNKNSALGQVVAFEKYKEYSAIIQKIVTIYRICFPLRILKRHALNKVLIHPYKRVYLCCFNTFSDSVKMLNSNTEFIQYEDGLGSYLVEDLEVHMRSRMFGFINRFILNNRLSYNTNTFYLNRPEAYNYSRYEQVKKIPERSIVNLKDVFDYKANNQYCNCRFIYLTQPLEETVMGEKAYEVEKNILLKMGYNVVLRVHPRQNKTQYSGYKIDEFENLWELECSEQITENHILIGAFSTAQFTPKMLFGKEPKVIFTYKLYGNTFKNADSMVKMLRSMYDSPERIMVAESFQHLFELLKDSGEKDE